MQSTVVKLYGYSQIVIPDEMRKWHVTEDEINEALALLSRDHMLYIPADQVAEGDALACRCIWGCDPEKTVLLYPGRGLPSAEEAEQASVGCKIGERITCRLGNSDVILEVKEILRLTPHKIDDELARLAEIPGISTIAEYRDWYIKENAPKKRFDAAQKIAVMFYEGLMEHSEFFFDPEEQRKWCTVRGMALYDSMSEFGEDPRRLKEGMENLSDEEVKEEYIKYVESFYKQYVLFRYLSNQDGFVYTHDSFLADVEKYFAEYGELLEAQGQTKEEYLIKESNYQSDEERGYMGRASEILTRAAEKFLED